MVSEAVRRAGVDPAAIDEVVLRAANQACEDNRNVARMAVLLAGLPTEVPGYTVNRLCASGLTALATAANAMHAGDADIVVADGVESMTLVPWVMQKPGTLWARPASCGTPRSTCWSHPNKPRHWIIGRYFGKFSKFRNDRWVFGDRDTGAYLPKPSWTDIVRHTLVKGGASPDDLALAGYWAQRRQKVKPPLDSYTVRLLSRQDGRCSLCGKTC